MHEDGFTVGSPLCAKGGLWLTRVEIAVHEIGNNFDGALDVELFDGLFEEILGDGGDAVGLLDGKFCDGEITAIAADESDVGAVERSDERQTAGSGHGTGEKRADGVGNSVVDVKEVERFGFEDFDHFGGESQRIGRVVEKRVAGDFDFVEVDAGVVEIHADGRGVADEVDVVAARGELLAELGGDDAGAAVGGIAGDADFHLAALNYASCQSSDCCKSGRGKPRPYSLVVNRECRDPRP